MIIITYQLIILSYIHVIDYIMIRGIDKILSTIPSSNSKIIYTYMYIFSHKCNYKFSYHTNDKKTVLR